MNTPAKRGAQASGAAWRAVRALIILITIADAIANAWVWRTGPDLVLSGLSAAAVIVTLFHPVPGALLAVIPVLSDILTSRDYGTVPLIVVTVMLAASARPRTALVVLTALAGLQAGHLWWTQGSFRAVVLGLIFVACLAVGLVLRWLAGHADRSSAELTQLEQRVARIRRDERETLAAELSDILTEDLRASGTLLREARDEGSGLASLLEVGTRARSSLTRLRWLVSTLRGVDPRENEGAHDLFDAVDEVEELLVGHGFSVELDVPDPATLPSTTDMDALLRVLREAADHIRLHRAGGTVHISLTSPGQRSRIAIEHRPDDGSPPWSVEEDIATRPGPSPETASAPQRPFLTRVSPHTARLALTLPAAAAAGLWLVGMVFHWQETPASAPHDLLVMIALLGLAIAPWFPLAAVLVLAGASLVSVGVLQAVPGATPVNVLGMCLMAVTAATWPRLVPVVGVGAVLTLAWWQRGADDPLLVVVPVMLLAFGASVGFGVRYFERLRAEHVAEFERLTQAFAVARTAERNHLAGELHDLVAHQLSLMTMVLMAHGDSDHPRPVAATRERLARLNTAAQADLATLVTLTKQAPSSHSSPGVTPSRAAEATAVTLRGAGHDVDVRISTPVDCSDPTAQRTVSRIVREAATNILRYAPPGSPVDMELTASEFALEIRVASDLPAAVRTNADSTGFGLAGLTERAALTGGTFDAGPVGNQWVVTAMVPQTPGSRRDPRRGGGLFSRRWAATGSDQRARAGSSEPALESVN